MAAWAGPGDDTDEEIRLCRIEYLGDDDWGFALYGPATETYEPAVLPGGPPFGSAVEAYDTAAIVHLTEYAECGCRLRGPPRGPCLVNRPRHLRTVSTESPSSAAKISGG